MNWVPCNVHLRSTSSQDVIRAAAEWIVAEHAEISPRHGECMTVLDEASVGDSPVENTRVAQELSSRLKCSAFALWFPDEDCFSITAFESGSAIARVAIMSPGDKSF